MVARWDGPVQQGYRQAWLVTVCAVPVTVVCSPCDSVCSPCDSVCSPCDSVCSLCDSVCSLCDSDRLVGLVVKASASRAGGPGFESR